MSRRAFNIEGIQAADADLQARDFKSMVERIPAVVYLAEAGEHGRWLYASPGIEDLLGFTVEEWLADPQLWAKRLHPDDRDRVLGEDISDFDISGPVFSDYRLITKDGRTIWVRDRATVVEAATGNPAYYQGLLVGIGEQKSAEQDLQKSERRFRSLLERGTDVVLILDSIAEIKYSSPSLNNVLGYSPEDVAGRVAFDFIHSLDAKPTLERFVGLVSGTPHADKGEFRVKHADGSIRWMEAQAVNLLEDDSVNGVVVNCRDITERRELQERLRHLAYHDSLTGLPNRSLFLDRLSRSQARLARSERLTGVIFIDVDDFKEINDRYGHAIGDEVLSHAAQKIQACLRPSDSAARLGGDEFGVILEDLNDPRDVEVVARRIFDELGRPLRVRGSDIPVKISAGVAIGESSDQAADVLLNEADKAMYRAKTGGKNRWLFADRQLPGLG